jgi:uncharacterized Tic20 family protein
MQEITKTKLLRAACHASALASWSVITVGVPIAALLMSNDPLVRDSAKESINFQISMILITIIGVALLFTVIGIPLGILVLAYVGLASLVLPIIAIVSVCADPEKSYRYPLTIRLLKPTLPEKICTSI